jgi:putative DNA primase/helicase
MNLPAFPPRPSTLNGDLANIPSALAPLVALSRWVAWRWELRSSRWTKPPVQPRAPYAYARNNDPRTWGTYAEALAACQAGHADGIGFNLMGSKFGAFDIDDCRDPSTGEIAPKAQALVDRAGSYAEITVSGTGLRVIGMACGARVHRKQKLDSTVSVESYRASERYIVVTGNLLPGTRQLLANIDAPIDAVVAELDARNGQGGGGGQSPSPFTTAKPTSTSKALRGLLPAGLLTLIDTAFPEGQRSERFHHAVCWLGDLGLGSADIEAMLVGKPIAEKYAGRLALAVALSLSKREPTPTKPNGRRPPSNDPITEDSAAVRFAELYGDRLRYCHDNGHWFEWTGAIWRPDKTGLAFHWARELARALADDEDARVRAAAGKHNFPKGVELFCRADRAFAVTADHWDSDPLLLGTPGGTIDLRSGLLRSADPRDAITKMTAIAPAETADCPLWRAFLSEAAGGDQGLVRFLQQWAGYCLTGETSEHALLFIYGAGGNGKSVFLNSVTGILSDYATTAAMETFTSSAVDKHPTDLAMLCGARLVTASETEEGRAWAEARIKQMTGGDPITARFMRQDFFTFTPTFKLTIIGNHQPVLRNVDEAARRRFNIVPFTRNPAQPDKTLGDKLRVEWPAILRWMIEGCLDWQANGLVRPQSVIDATADYFAGQDLFAQWLADECDAEPGNIHKWETTATLFASWSTYAKAAGEPPGTVKSFAPAMLRHGLTPKRTKAARAFSGVRLRPKPSFPSDG